MTSRISPFRTACPTFSDSMMIRSPAFPTIDATSFWTRNLSPRGQHLVPVAHGQGREVVTDGRPRCPAPRSPRLGGTDSFHGGFVQAWPCARGDAAERADRPIGTNLVLERRRQRA